MTFNGCCGQPSRARARRRDPAERLPPNPTPKRGIPMIFLGSGRRDVRAPVSGLTYVVAGQRRHFRSSGSLWVPRTPFGLSPELDPGPARISRAPRESALSAPTVVVSRARDLWGKETRFAGTAVLVIAAGAVQTGLCVDVCAVSHPVLACSRARPRRW